VQSRAARASSITRLIEGQMKNFISVFCAVVPLLVMISVSFVG
jgi:hypothetical protein